MIAGLHALADFLQAHPDLPVNCWAQISYSVTAGGALGEDDSDTAKRAEVDRVAEILGVSPHTEADGEHYIAVKRFGPVTYQAAAITEAFMAAYDAASTYHGCVTP
jgi:hypothetical protein